MPSISVNSLDLNFGSVEVLKNLNLDIEDGEFLVLLGPSGCGKSTLLNCIAGLLDVSDGQIFIKGRNVTWEEPKDRGIGMVFQSYALYPQMTVKGNLQFGLKNAGVPKGEIEQRIQRTAEILQIEALLHRKPAALSGGQRQRVAIGRALVRDVDVFLFDEPLSNLDAKLRSELRVEIKRLHQKLGNTMVYVTHDQIEALTLADRIAVMRNGVIQQLDEPKSIYTRPANLYVAGFLGSPSMSFVPSRIHMHAGEPHFKLNDELLSLSGYNYSDQVVADQDVVVGLRPEHIGITEYSRGIKSRDGFPVISGVVDIEEPMGADTLIWVKVGEHVISVRVSGEQSFGTGQTVVLSFNMSLASVFDVKTEQRL